MGSAAAPQGNGPNAVNPVTRNSAKTLDHKLDEVLKPLVSLGKWKTRYETVTWLANFIVLAAPVVGAVLLWIVNTTVSFVHILFFTAPLTLAAMSLVIIYRSVERWNFWGFVLVTIGVLAAAAFLSSLVGSPVNGIERYRWPPPQGWAGIGIVLHPIFWLLGNFYSVYHAGPFFVSLITGSVAGWLIYEARTKSA